MAYTEEFLGGAVVPHVAADLDDLTGAAVHTTSFSVGAEIEVNRIMALVTTAVVSTGAVVVAMKRYPTYGSSASAETIGTLSIPAATVAGKVLYKDVTPVICYPGDQLVFEVTTAAAGGGAAGNAAYMFNAVLRPEAAANQSDMVASA